MLQQNGSLEKLSGLDPEVKKQMADEILKLIQSQDKKPEAAGEVPLPPMPAEKPANPVAKQSNYNDPKPNEMNENIWLFKEAYIILTEMPNASNVSGANGEPDRGKVKKAIAGMDSTGKKTAPAAPAASPAAAPATPPAAPAAAPATPPAASPAAPAATATPAAQPAAPQDPSKAKVKDILAKPDGFKIDDPEKLKKVTAYKNELDKEYKELSSIPGASRVELLAVVKNFDKATGKATVNMLNKGETLPDGKANYKLDDKTFNVPINAVKERMPVQQAQKTGLLSRIFGR
jgi:hypothetical protein